MIREKKRDKTIYLTTYYYLPILLLQALEFGGRGKNGRERKRIDREERDRKRVGEILL